MLHSRVVLRLAAGAIACMLANPTVQAQSAGTGAFPDASAIEKQLQRGQARKADVQRVLGVPNGTGRADMLPYPALQSAALGEGAREIWYYDDIEVTNMQSTAGVVNMKMRQQILLVFFRGELYDGFLWTTNVTQPTAVHGGSK